MPRCPTCFRRLASARQCPEHPDVGVVRRAPLRAEPFSLPGYEIGTRLGGGGFAVVWSALRSSDGQEVAIKVSHAFTAKAARRFEREAQALERVGPPHVPELLARGRLDDGRAYLIMELLGGKPLATWLGERARAPRLSRLLEIMDAVLESVQAVHESDLVHGDLKPENIILCGPGGALARLIDFGVIRTRARSTLQMGFEDEREETMEEIIGSAEYMAPEQLLGVVAPTVDVYAAGVLLYEMLTLRVPFVGDVASIRHGHRALRPPHPGLFANVPAPMEELCLACLAKDSTRRPGDIVELRHRLTDAVARSEHASRSKGSRASRPSSSVLNDARQPVVLMAVEIEASTRSVVHIVERNKGVVARQIGRRFVCGFSALDDAEPIRSALDTAHELVLQYSARVVVHIAQVKVRRRRRGHSARLFGPAIQDVRAWKPERDWRGILLTGKVAEALPSDLCEPSKDHPGFFHMTARDGRADTEPTLLRLPIDVPLVGRDQELEDTRASLAAVLESGTPGLCTVYAENGMGKSRFSQELVAMARALVPDAVVLWTRANRQLLGRTDETMRTLLELLAEYNLVSLPRDHRSLSTPAAARILGNGLRARGRVVVLVLDDAHHADSATLDALEYATLDGEDIRLWVVALGRTRLRLRRPRWGQRANRHTVIELLPLSEDSAMELAATLLQPAEYPPAATLERLARWAAGSPHALEELVRTLKREGMVRKRLRNDSWYVATAALEYLPASPAGQWLAARRLDALPVELAACLRLCAVLGVEFLRDELEWVQNIADESGSASSSIDTDVGLTELERLGFLESQSGVYSFKQAAFQDAVYNLLSARDRVRIHGYALQFWRNQAEGERDARVLTAIARHANASNATDEAADAYLELGDRARSEHRDVSADQYYSQALAVIAADDHRRQLRALSGRGRVRYRIQRGRESLTDLQDARAHARALGDDDGYADLLLEESIALDWDWQFKLSAARVEEARPLAESSADDRLRAKFWCSLGRIHAREERLQEALDALLLAITLAEECDADDVRIIALTMKAGVLGWVGRADEAMARFDELIPLCERSGDRLHLCAAYSNRGTIWTAGSDERVASDLTHAVQLAREVGQPVLERSAAHNLADFLYRQGKHQEALSLARRSYELQRFFPEKTHVDALLVARILAAMGDRDGVRGMLEQVRALSESLPLTQSESIVAAMLELMLAGSNGTTRDADAWRALTDRGREHLPGEEFLDLLYCRARTAVRSDHGDEVREVLAEARSLLPSHPSWRLSFESLSDSNE